MSQPVIWFSFVTTGTPDEVGAERDINGQGTIGKAVLLQPGEPVIPGNPTVPRIWRVYFQTSLPNTDYVVQGGRTVPGDPSSFSSGFGFRKAAHYIEIEVPLMGWDEEANVFIYSI